MHSTLDRSPSPGAIALDLQAFERLCERYGLRSDAQIAAAFGVERSVVNRVRRGTKRPGVGFVAGALRAWRGVRFEELFLLTERDAA